MASPLPPEEWKRRVASMAENLRVLDAEAADMQEMADMLRERGHEYPAERLEQSIREADEIVADARALVEGEGEGEHDADA